MSSTPLPNSSAKSSNIATASICSDDKFTLHPSASSVSSAKPHDALAPGDVAPGDVDPTSNNPHKRCGEVEVQVPSRLRRSTSFSKLGAQLRRNSSRLVDKLKGKSSTSFSASMANGADNGDCSSSRYTRTRWKILTRAHVHSLTHPLTRSPTHTLTHSPTHSYATHSFDVRNNYFNYKSTFMVSPHALSCPLFLRPLSNSIYLFLCSNSSVSLVRISL